MIGDRVRLKSAPPYLKTADTMPMLRPGDLIPIGTQGIVLEQKAAGYWTNKFEAGAFFVDGTYLEKAIFDTDAAKTTP